MDEKATVVMATSLSAPALQSHYDRTTIALHETAANTTLVVAALHAGAALVHHYVFKDNVLRQMLFSRARG